MSLLPFELVTTVGAVLALLLRSNARVATAIAVGGLFAAAVTALAISPGQSVVIGGAGIATTEYLRLFLVLGATVGLLLAVVGQAVGSARDAAAVTLGVLATSALALSLPDARIAVLAATAGGGFGALVTLAPTGGRVGATVGTRVLRATVVAGTMAVAATAWIGRDLTDLAAQPVVFGLAYLAFALAVAIRFGAIPLHTWAAPLTDNVPETALPLVTAWAPAAFAIVALAWADASIAPLLVDLDAVRFVVLAIAISSIVLASVAALIQDDIEHIVGYAIIGDAGVILLAIAALDPAAWAPARTWILAFVVARSAFAAWAAATRSVFFTGRLTDLRGWAIRSPALGVILGVVVVASVGVPGLAAFDARGTIVALAIDGPLGALVLLGALSPLLYYGRVLLVGVGRPAGGAASARSLRPVVSPVDLTDLRSWLTRTWSDNLAVTATGGAALLAILALAVSFGAFGASSAAAGLPPTLDVSRESFAPEDPQAPVGSDAPSAPPADGEAGEAPSAPPSDDEPSEAPPAPSPDGSPSGAPSP
ncbi:MAG: Proton-conducting rane transporter [Chloroflexota bacterium]|nr:Proton-conducting rane transporter [Chloroflexota bacterium]